MKGSFTRLPGRGDALEVQAKVCIDCGQLVLTYKESVKCIVCGGMLRPVKKSDR
jgi:hypothetical protein